MDTLRSRQHTRADGRAIPAWLRLMRVFQKVNHASVEQLRPWNLSVAQFDVLARAGADEGLTQQELADGLFVTKGNICQLVDRLERAGLLERRPEGRANRLFLTEAGRALYAQVVPEHEALIARQLAALTAAEQAELHRLLRKLDRALS